MTLWRKTRTEMAGAWRSLRYDLGRRDEPGREVPVLRPGSPDVTSTGMSTFGGAEEVAWPAGEAGTHRRPPRRLAAVTAFGALAVAGAAGSYLAVVSGLGGLLVEQPAAAGPYPLAIGGEQDRGHDQVASNAGIGQGTARRPVPAPALPAATSTPGVPVQTLTQPAPIVTTVTRTVPVPQAPAPTSPDCDCLEPPVPTPTDVPSGSPSPDVSEPEPPVPTDSASAPAPTDSAPPGPSASPENRRTHRKG